MIDSFISIQNDFIFYSTILLVYVNNYLYDYSLYILYFKEFKEKDKNNKVKRQSNFFWLLHLWL